MIPEFTELGVEEMLPIVVESLTGIIRTSYFSLPMDLQYLWYMNPYE